MGDFLMTYKDEVVRSMKMLADNDTVVFMGQLVNCWGCIYDTLTEIPPEKKIELPIIEDTQMGMATGMALNGYIPITIYSRMDFLILAMNQLVNHLDKLEEMSHGDFKPKVIIRTIVGAKHPLNAGAQHTQDHTEMVRASVTNIDIVKLLRKEDIYPAYKSALDSDKSTIIIEVRELYDE